MSPERTIKRFIFALFFFAISGGTAFAQIPTYVSRQFPQPYAPLGAGSTPIFNFMAWDQSVNIPIGFTFRYYGVDYNTIEVAENGIIMFKSACGQCSFDEFCDFNTMSCLRGWTGTPFDGLPAPSTPNKLVAAWWDDLSLDTAAANPSIVQYRMIGAQPNRTLIVEWRNIRHYSNFSPNQNSTSRTSFQIQLQETSNNVRIAYGPYSSNVNDNSLWNGRVGVEDQNGTNSIIPLTCAQNQGTCDNLDLAVLNNQVIEIGVPNVPELTGSIQGAPGALPGDSVTVYVNVENVGLQPTTGPFDVAVYLSTDNVIVPTTDTLLGTGSLAFVRAGGIQTATITATLPLSFPPGYYNVGAYIDSANVIVEATEQNNIIVGESLFLAGADLEVFFSQPPPPLPVNGSDTAVFSVTNRSSTVNNMQYRVHLSLDSLLDGSDPLISQQNISFPASQTTEVFAPATVPASVLPGYYFMIVTVDPTNVLAEADEFNNQAIDFVTVGPDLYISDFRSPATSGRGAELELSLDVGNSGSTVNETSYDIWFSTDFSIQPGTDILIATGVTPAPRGAVTTVPIVVEVPTNIAPGTYNIIINIDPQNATPELDEFNNEAAWTTITLIGPDLSAESLTGDRLAFLGQPYRATAVISNLGGEPVNGFFTSFHLSANQLCTASDPILVEVGPTDLDEGDRITLNPTIVIPENTALGLYYLCVITDSQSLVQEDREQNNIRRANEQVTVRDIAPDFVITDLLIPSIAGAGETFPLQRTLENQGNNNGNLTYDIYLVTQSGSMRLALIGRASLTLAIGEIHNGVDNVTIPADVSSGIYRVEYALDPEGLTDEIFEDNNITRSDETIEVENAQLYITTNKLPVATTGVEYQADLFAMGGAGPLTWSISAGTLPEGLSLDDASGRISGVSNTEAVAMFTVSVTDGSLSHSRMLTLTVAAPTVDLKIVSRSIPPVWVGQHYEYPLTALGGVPPYAWTVRPALPAGLTLTSSGTLAGDTSTTAPSFVYTFRVEDAVGDFAESPLTVRVLARDDALRFLTLSLADGIVGSDYSEDLFAENGVPEYQFTLVDGQLPPGLVLNRTNDGTELSGVPTEPGTFTFQLRVADSRGDFDLNYFVVEIDASESVSFVTKGLPPAKLNAEYKDRDERPVSLKAIVLSGSSTIEYSVVQGMLPPGVTLSTNGTFSGAPTMKGVFPFTARAYDPVGKTEDLRAFGIVVDEEATVPPPPPGEGCDCNATSSNEGGAGSLAVLGLLIAFLVSRRRLLLGTSTWLIALFLGFAPAAYAQRMDAGIPDTGTDAGTGNSVPYFVSQYAETYVSRTGGTQLSFSSQDDGESIYQLDFPFKYFGTFYNEVHVGTNGYVSFVSWATDLSGDSFPTPFEPNGVIAWFWDDLYLGVVTVHLEGTAPNRILIIQWDDMEHYPFGSSEDFEVQLWLYEGNAARFELHYGQTANLNTASFVASAGFENADGTEGQNFLPCTPSCQSADLELMTDQVIRALQDAGEDIFALRLSADVTGDPLRLFQGINFDVRSLFAAYHENPVGPFTYSIYLMEPNELTPSTPPIFVSQPTTLGAYETLEVIDSVSIPLTIQPGRYRIALEVDSGGDVNEPNETNNFVIGTQEFLVGARAPDLSITSISPPSGPIAPGSSVQVAFDIANIGNLDANAGWRVVLSPNRAPSVNDVIIAESASDQPFMLGQTSTIDVQAMIPANLRPGRYYFGAIVDPGNTVAELIEVNNIARSDAVFDVASPTVLIDTASLPVAYKDVTYETRLVAAGGNGNYVWELIGGTLPAGLTFVGGPVGEFRGTPTELASANLTIKVTSNNVSDEKTLTLDVRELSGPLTIVTRELLPGMVGETYPPADPGQDPETQQRILAVGGTGETVRFTLDGGAPAGLVLDENGYLHGIPESRGTFMVSVSATDGETTTTRVLPLTIVEPGRLSLLIGALPNATLGEPYSYTFFTVGQAMGTTLQFDFVEGSGATPPGLEISRSEGTLSGVPMLAGTFNFSIRVVEGTMANPPHDTAAVTLVVEAPPGSLSITPTMVPDAVVGEIYTVTFEARQGMGPFIWTVENTNDLPPGLMFEEVEVDGANKLRLAGTPTALPSEISAGTNTGGVVSFLVKLDDGEGRHTEQSIALRVIEKEKPPVDGGNNGGGGCGCNTQPSTKRSVWLAPLLLGMALFIRRRRPR